MNARRCTLFPVPISDLWVLPSKIPSGMRLPDVRFGLEGLVRDCFQWVPAFAYSYNQCNQNNVNKKRTPFLSATLGSLE